MTKSSILHKAQREIGISIRFHQGNEIWENANELFKEKKIRIYKKIQDGAIFKATT
jgi:hypothetical protein